MAAMFDSIKKVVSHADISKQAQVEINMLSQVKNAFVATFELVENRCECTSIVGDTVSVVGYTAEELLSINMMEFIGLTETDVQTIMGKMMTNGIVLKRNTVKCKGGELATIIGVMHFTTTTTMKEYLIPEKEMLYLNSQNHDQNSQNQSNEGRSTHV